MYSRKDYIFNGTCSHIEYYSQFVNDNIKRILLSAIPLEVLKKSTDEHFNDIPMSRFDNLVNQVAPHVSDKLKACGDWFTLSGNICILKEAARQLVR